MNKFEQVWGLGLAGGMPGVLRVLSHGDSCRQTGMAKTSPFCKVRLLAAKNSKRKFFCTLLLICIKVFDNESFIFTYYSVESRIDSFVYTVGDKNCGSVQSKPVQTRLIRVKCIAMNCRGKYNS